MEASLHEDEQSVSGIENSVARPLPGTG